MSNPANANTPTTGEACYFPAAVAQQVFWFHQQMQPENTAFNVAVRFLLHGPLDVSILEKVFNEILQRHEALRTQILDENGELLQVVLPSTPIKIDVIDLSSLPEETRRTETERQGTIEAQKPFDLRIAPLIRCNLLRLKPEEFMLQVTVHHVVSDGWSIGLITDEMAALYSAFAKGEPSPLPTLPVQFADFTLWQHEYLKSPEMAAQIAYWKKRLTGYVEPNLPTDRPRPPAKTWNGDIVSILLPQNLTDQLKQIGQASNASVFMVFLTAFKVLLARYSGQTDIALGSPIVCRNRPEIEKLIGVFINTLILRTDLSGNPSFRTALDRVKETVLDAMANQDLPFEQLVRELQPKRDLSRNPLTQINFTHQRDFVKPVAFSGIKLTAIPSRSPGAIFDLHFFMVERDGIWRASCDYSSDLYDRETAIRMLGHFRQLLENAARSPETPIFQLPMLTDSEHSQLLDEWNKTTREYPREKCLHELFEEQARLAPDRTALITPTETLSYRELDKRSTSFARVLRAEGVQPDSLVALCVERSADMVVGLLGILKAGGAYVPVDPTYPADRIAFVLEDSQARIIVTQKNLLGGLPPTKARTLLINDPSTTANEPSVNAKNAAPENLAYVLYTSGSTGRPKGVQISHRAVVNFLNSMRREPGLTAKDTLLAVTTLSFDIAGLELYLPLTTGASIVLAPWEVAADGEAIINAINRHNITLLQATPATWRMMLAAGWKGTPTLKALCGGEAMPADLAAQLLPRTAELWNMYGPTETTIWSTCCRVTEPASIHIGRPIDNTLIYILDPQLQPVPVGVPGELMIGGDGLARGYWNRPELTADRFIDNPFRPGEKIYRTGDLAQYRPDGNINCLGRLDHQVKIRGFRIELQEIENQLITHPGVKQVVVTVREDTPGEKRLVAYYVPGESPTTTDSLRQHLHAKLPDYMVPATFVSLPALPLTPNGKIDRKALPSPDTASGASAHDTRIPPANPTERQLAEIFQSLLGVPTVFANDSFFDLGGHSLLAAKLMASIEKSFGHRLPLAYLFDSPTVTGLAKILDKPEKTAKSWSSLVPIRPAEGKPALFMIHGAGGNVLLYREVADALRPDVSVYGLQSQGLDHSTPPLTKVEDMAALYVEEMRSLQPTGPYHMTGYCMGGAIVFEMARILESQGQKTGLVALLDSYNLALVDTQELRRHKWNLRRQKLVFHLRNLARLGFGDLFGYFREKIRMAKEASVEAASTSWETFNHRLGRNRKASMGTLMSINHAAGWAYVPKAIQSDVTLFRPATNYDFMSDPEMGWRGVVKGKLDIVELSANPHAMLIAPCANQLATEIRNRLTSPNR